MIFAAGEKVKQQLRKNNPFVSSSAGDPWDTKYPHVESVNKAALDGICQLIRQKAAAPGENIAALVLGEVGQGKTHLIGRVLKHGQQSGPAFSFAYVQPIEDPERTFRYLLREVLANLCHPADASSSSGHIERIIAMIFKEHLEEKLRSEKAEIFARLLGKIRENPLNVFKESVITPAGLGYLENDILDIMANEYPKFQDHLPKVLLQYRFPEKRKAALRWLKGSITDKEDATLLGIPGRQNGSEAFLEQEARDILHALGELMARYGDPMIVCFDRLENLESDEQIHSLGKMIEFLVDTAKAMLPLACFRELKWLDTFKKKLNQHVISRVETNAFELEGCTPEQGMEIVRCRLKFAGGEELPDDFFPFDKDELLQIFKQGGIQTPRQFITQANYLLRKILGESAEPLPLLEQLQEIFERQYQAILGDFDRHDPDRGRLRRALELCLTHLPSQAGFEIEGLKRFGEQEKYVDFMGQIRVPGKPSADAIFIIDVTQNHPAVRAAISRGLDFFEKFPSGRAFYIRDGRCPIPSPPRWPATNKVREQFEARGGQIIVLDTQQAARWYALALFSYAVKEGEVSLMGTGGREQPVSEQGLSEFVRKKIHGGKDAAFQIFGDILRDQAPNPKPAPSPSPHPEVIAEKITEILRPLPMMTASVQTVAASLDTPERSAAPEDILTIISQFQDRFVVFPSKDGEVIMLKKDWVHAQG